VHNAKFSGEGDRRALARRPPESVATFVRHRTGKEQDGKQEKPTKNRCNRKYFLVKSFKQRYLTKSAKQTKQNLADLRTN